MSSKPKIILASASPFRSQLLRNAGVEFDVVPAAIDERAVEEPLVEADLDADDIAEMLAQTKALEVLERYPDAYVIGCDQTLSLEDQILHKPADMEEARARLLELSGKTHYLNSAVALAADDEIIWSHVSVCAIRMRRLDPGFIGRHLANVGHTVLASVGAYQIEGRGVQLFEEVKGDFFSIMGLPVLPLLAELRSHNLVDG